jgi:hypothetical protein
MSPTMPIQTPLQFPSRLKKLSSFEKLQDLKMEMERRENLISTFEDCGELLLILILPIEFTEMIHMNLVKELKELLLFIFPSIGT